MALIKCEGLTLGYGGTAAVRGLDLTVERGDYLSIIGENGSGKSTLVKGLLGLLRPLSGSIEYGDGLTRRGIGYLPQTTEVRRDFPATVLEVILSGCISGRRLFYSRADRERACEVMRRLHIHELEGKSFSRLSGGQQKRVLLARALCATRTLLLLDEPQAGLDPEITAELYSIVDGLNERDGITVVIVSHDLDEVMGASKHVLHVNGAPVFYGTRAEYAAYKNGGQKTGEADV